MKTKNMRLNGLVWHCLCGLGIAVAVGCSDESDGDQFDSPGGATSNPDAGGAGGGFGSGGKKGSSSGGTGTGGSTSGAGGSGGTPSRPNWERVVTPLAVGADAPLQCANLEQDNCWKGVVDQALDCSPLTTGTLSLDGRSCTFDNGSRIEFSEAVAGREGYIFAQYSVIKPDGSECFTVKVDGIGDYTIQA